MYDKLIRTVGVVLLAGFAGKAIESLFSEEPDIVDCSSELMKFYNECVRLPDSEQQKLRTHRDTNQQRLRNGLAREEYPSPLYFVKQGSYAVDTINRSPSNDYDIDDGVVFDRAALRAVYGRDMTPREAKEMVRSVLLHNGFSKPPQILKNCVRVYYAGGHHVDVPVYREYSEGWWTMQTRIELASGDEWRKSDPEADCKWFLNAVKDKSPDKENGRQLRRIVRLLKAYSRSRVSWNMPSGFILTILAVERYRPFANRDDLSLYETMKAIHRRLQNDLSVNHPIGDRDIASDKQTKMAFLRDRLGDTLASMEDLENEDCTEEEAFEIWSDVFNTDFFADLI